MYTFQRKLIIKSNQRRYTFSLVSDIDLEKSCFLCRIKIDYQQFCFLSVPWTFQEQPFGDVLEKQGP